MSKFAVAKRGTDSSGRGIYATEYMWNWYQGVLSRLPFGEKVVVTQGAFMTLAGGGAAGSAGYHDKGGCFDLRVWNLTDAEVGHLVRELRRSGAAAWHRDVAHGGFTDPHIHFVLGTDQPLSAGAAMQWSEYQRDLDGMHGRDYHWRPDPLVLTPPKPKPEKATFRIATHNVWVGQRGLKLRRNLRRMWKDAGYPHVIALQEAHGLKSGFFRYKRHAVSPMLRKEADNCVLLVRRDVEWIRRRLLMITAPDWFGPKHGNRHPARIFLGGAVAPDLQAWEVLNLHRATSSGGKNRATRLAEAEQLIEWVKTRLAHHPHRPIVLIGDWNGRPLAIAKELGAQVAMHGIDGALTIGATCLSVRELEGKYGSDNHHPVVIELKENS